MTNDEEGLSHMFIIMFISVAFLASVYVLHLSGTSFKLLQAIPVWGLKQVSKFLEAHISNRKRMFVWMYYLFVFGRTHISVFTHPPLSL